MDGQPRSTDQAAGAFTDEATRALRALAGYPGEPIILGYHPVAWINPYQSLLYQRAWEAGIAPLQLTRAERVTELAALARLGFAAVLHLHWLTPVLRDETSAGGARRAADRFLRHLDTFTEAGGRLVWTVHNVLEHDSRFSDEQARLRAGIVERADVVHVMTAGTADHVRRWYRIPDDKLLHVDHPSYTGAYEDRISTAQARHELGIMPDELVYAAVGRIRPYKGLAELLDAWDRLDHDRPRRLVIAGPPGQEPGMAEVLERAAVHPTVLLHARAIPSDEIQVFLRAADVAVLPYVQSLNSGALFLALTFGVPAILSGHDGLAEVVEPAFARTFAPGDVGELTAALAAAHELATPEGRSAARAAAERRSPAALSETLARQLRNRLGLGPGG